MKTHIEEIRKLMFEHQQEHGFSNVFDHIDDELRQMEDTWQGIKTEIGAARSRNQSDRDYNFGLEQALRTLSRYEKGEGLHQLVAQRFKGIQSDET